MSNPNDSIFPPLLTSKEPPEIRITDPSRCFYCGSAPLAATMTHCPVCHFPQHGTALEQHAFIEDKREKAAQHLKYEQTIGWAQTILFYSSLSAIVASIGFWLMFSSAGIMKEEFLAAIFYTVLAASPNILLWYWSKKKPLPALQVALALVIIGLIAQVLFAEIKLTSFIFPALEIAVFIHAMVSYKSAVKIEEELLVEKKSLGH